MFEIVNPDAVKIARESRGETQKTLAKKARVPQSSISKIEQGALPCTDNVLKKIMRATRYPKQFFLESELLPCSISTFSYREDSR